MSGKILVYVIGAYSGNVTENIKKAEEASIALIRAGYHVFTPHKNTAGYEKYQNDLLAQGIYLTYQTWIDMDLDILSRCDAIFIMDSAKDSKGSQIEIAFAKEHNIPEVTTNLGLKSEAWVNISSKTP